MDWSSVVNIAVMFAVLAGALGVVFVALRALDALVFPRLDFEEALRRENLPVGIVIAAVILGVFLLAGRAIGAPADRYDASFRKAARLHFGYRYDWRYFKAQGMTESGLRPEVCSHAGACGLMQFMPGTALAMGLSNRFNAKQSIRKGVAYDKQLWRQWSAPRPSRERLNLAFASYNAGLGHVLKAQRRAGGGNRYAEIAPHLWREPREYVERIQRWQTRFAKGKATAQPQHSMPGRRHG